MLSNALHRISSKFFASFEANKYLLFFSTGSLAILAKEMQGMNGMNAYRIALSL